MEPVAKDVHLMDEIMMPHLALFKSRPLRDGGGKPSPGRLPPPRRPISCLGRRGKQIMALVLLMVPQTIWSTQCGEKQHPFPDKLLEEIRGILGAHPGLEPASRWPTLFLDFIRDLATAAADPDKDLPTDLAKGVTTPPLQSPGIWLLKSALKGVDFVPQDLEDPVGRANYSSVNDFVSQARATFMEEVDLAIVDGAYFVAFLNGCQ